eukprot:4677341-Prymnesium_polylepis.1
MSRRSCACHDARAHVTTLVRRPGLAPLGNAWRESTRIDESGGGRVLAIGFCLRRPRRRFRSRCTKRCRWRL